MKKIILINLAIIIVSCGQVREQNENNNGKDLNISKANTEETQLKQPITGVINSIVDGFDVKNVNLYSSTLSDRHVVCSLKNGDKVYIIEENDLYYLVEKKEDNTYKGYCMKGFVSLDNPSN